MTKPKDTADLTPPISAAVSRVVLKALVPPALTSLHRALFLSTAYHWKLDLEDVERVESMWELLDLDSTSHGFVLALHDGRRFYLQYVMAPGGDDDVSEDVTLLPMKDERYPQLKGGELPWEDDVERLNELLQD
jgi:hypothetical protein